MIYTLKEYDISDLNSTNILFVQPHWDYTHEGIISIILSPAYYYVKRVEQEAMTAKQVKKIAPSMFDLEDGYTYEVVEGDTMLVIAYHPKEIKRRLQDQGIDIRSVKTLYLAQHYFNDLREPILVDENRALVCVDGVITLIDPQYCEAITPLENALVEVVNKKNTAIAGIGSFDISRLYRVGIAAGVLFGLIIVFKFMDLYVAEQALVSKDAKIQSRYALPATSYQLKAMVSELQAHDKKVRFMRTTMKRLRLHNGLISGKVQSIKLYGNKLVLTTDALPTLTQTKLKKLFKKASLSTTPNSVILEVKR